MKTFEEALSELKEIIEKLEDGDLSLEESVSLFERGIKLVDLCYCRLNEVQRKVEILVECEDGEMVRKSFNPEEE